MAKSEDILSEQIFNSTSVKINKYSMGVIRLTGAVPRLEACWIQIILSLILEIQNNINTQKHKYLCKNHFFLKKKIMKQTLNQFTIIKKITIILKFMPNLRFMKYNNKSTS